MKNKWFVSLVMVSVLAIVFSGCVTKNPAFNPASPPSVNNQPYMVDPKIDQASNTITTIGNAVAPVNPYAPLTNLLTWVGFAIAGGVSTWLTQRKNTAAQTNAADSLAQAIVSAKSPTLLNSAKVIAGENGSTLAVTHLENNSSTSG